MIKFNGKKKEKLRNAIKFAQEGGTECYLTSMFCLFLKDASLSLKIDNNIFSQKSSKFFTRFQLLVNLSLKKYSTKKTEAVQH